MIEQNFENKKIQTGLSVKVDGVRVDYKRKDQGFAYEFVVHIGEYEGDCKDIEMAREVINSVVDEMVSQSYDHGSQWRIVEKCEDTTMIQRYGQFIMLVTFRIRDAW